MGHLRLGGRLGVLQGVGEGDDADRARSSRQQPAFAIGIDSAEVGELGPLECARVHLETFERALGVALGHGVLAAGREGLEVHVDAVEPAVWGRGGGWYEEQEPATASHTERKSVSGDRRERRLRHSGSPRRALYLTRGGGGGDTWRRGGRAGDAGRALDEHDAARGEHEPAVQHAAVRLARLRLERRRARLVHPLRLGERGAGEEGEQTVGARVRAHAAGVGAGVADVRALVVLDGRHVRERLAVAEREHRELLAQQLLADDECGKTLLAVGHRLVDRGEVGAGDLDALAAAEAVGFDDVVPLAQALQVLTRAGEAGERLELGQPAHAVLREQLERVRLG